ncbi:MAG: ABC transporter ATP-binding protein [Fibrobacteria bacterium]|nr:ABC transporter ATP-binding protein [Fibrobacteria bacterium]
MKSPPLVSLLKVDKCFTEVGGRVDVLKCLDFKVAEGAFLAIRGASGVGKSTLLHILGLLDTPTKGKILLNGEEITRFSDRKISHIRNRDIGFVFQFHHLLPDFTALENVLMPARISGAVSSREKAYCKELIALVGMDHRLEHLPSELSGGERQRLALARALIRKPKLLLADEPSGNLDEENTKKLHQLLKDVHENLGVTIVLATHDISLSALADERFVMHDGTITQEITEEQTHG